MICLDPKYPIVKATGWSALHVAAHGPGGGSRAIPRHELKPGMDLMPLVTDYAGGWTSWGSLIVEDLADDRVRLSAFDVVPLKTSTAKRSNVAPYEDGAVSAWLDIDGIEVTMPDAQGREHAFRLDAAQADIWQKAVRDSDPDALLEIIDAIESLLPEHKDVAEPLRRMLDKTLAPGRWTHLAVKIEARGACVDNSKYEWNYETPVKYRDAALFAVYDAGQLREGEPLGKTARKRVFMIAPGGALANAIDCASRKLGLDLVAVGKGLDEHKLPVKLFDEDIVLHPGDKAERRAAVDGVDYAITLSLEDRPWLQIEACRESSNLGKDAPFPRLRIARGEAKAGMAIPALGGTAPEAAITEVGDDYVKIRIEGEEHTIYTGQCLRYGKDGDWQMRLRLLDRPEAPVETLEQALEITKSVDPAITPFELWQAWTLVGKDALARKDFDKAARAFNNAYGYWVDSTPASAPACHSDMYEGTADKLRYACMAAAGTLAKYYNKVGYQKYLKDDTEQGLQTLRDYGVDI